MPITRARIQSLTLPPSGRHQVLYGMDYTADQRAEQQALLRGAILDHLRHAPESRKPAPGAAGQQPPAPLNHKLFWGSPTNCSTGN